LDHFERGRLLLTGVELLVIDEADRMLDMGFIPDIERIVKLLPPNRQTMLFSATMPGEIARLAAQFLRDPVRVEVSRPASTGENVTQTLVPSDPKPPDKRATLRRLLRQSDTLRNAIIFCNRKRDVATVARSLERHGFSAGALHGDMDQYARMRTLETFRDGTIKLLVASDVAARGLDIPDVSHIVNFDVPTHAEDYVHRIGRTARAGKTGEALTIVTPAERKYVAAIEKLIGQPIAWAEAPPPADEQPVRRHGRGKAAEEEQPRRGRRPGESAEDSEKPERAERSGRGRRGRGRKPRPADGVAEQMPASEAAWREEAPPPQAGGAAETRSPAAQAKPDRPTRAPRPESKPAGRGGRAKAVAGGFEDHVPAFLLRPVRLPRDAEGAEDEDGQA
ncbi:MAG TPA: DEAD/DEAH box helicase, partial [Afifellaceae bacterium]|nr:DEAD/DEAH box helicase [Afifellaceae bacterium]